jgi:hypothetical protein
VRAGRGWPVVVLLVVAAAFAYAVHAAIAGHEDVTAVPPLALAAVSAALLGATVAALRVLFPRVRALGAPAAACLTLSAALLAATPVDVSYDDGCNDHGSLAPLAWVPVLAAVRPALARGVYDDFTTEMACFTVSRPPQ